MRVFTILRTRLAKMPAAKYAGILSPEANNIVPPPTPPKKLR
jgi:hypothetical protein